MSNPKDIAEKLILQNSTVLNHELAELARAYLELEKENDRLKNYEIAGYEKMHNEMKAEITKLKKSREELRKFVDHCCSWNEGEVVTGRFDSPWTAREAREALKADDELMKEGE